MKLSKTNQNTKVAARWKLTSIDLFSHPYIFKVDRAGLRNMIDYCDQNSLLTNRQHSFFRGKSMTITIIGSYRCTPRPQQRL